MSERINVTKTFSPPIEEYQAYLEGIWERSYFTNQGPLLLDFQKKIEEKLGVSNFHFVTNGTLALQIALRALGITEGEVITTPFSYVATTSAILWEHCTPVYVDIDPKTLCIDANKIEESITENTKAILAVHVFGIPCDIEAIEKIAKKHKLKVIYDAAHAFGVTYKGRSIFSYGDISITSFHATKLFHTIEGGGIFVNEASINDTVELTKRFGHEGDNHLMLGLNAKASEFQAAMGLCNLKYIDEIIASRKHIFNEYVKQLALATISTPDFENNGTQNYAYLPVLFKSEKQLLSVFKGLNDENIFPRRYFFPSLNKLPYVTTANVCPISEDISTRVACLPLYVGLSDSDIARICDIVNHAHEV